MISFVAGSSLRAPRARPPARPAGPRRRV